VHRRSYPLLATSLTLAASLLVGAEAQADTLHTRSSKRAGAYVPVEELGYEYILDADNPSDARLALRVTVHNPSATNQDLSLALALPRKSQLLGARVRRGGAGWTDTLPTTNRGLRGRRDQGNIYIRQVPGELSSTLERAEVIAFDMGSGETIQVELELEIFPELHGDRWQLDLPRRNAKIPNLSSERRVVVRGLGQDQNFWVDEVSNGEAKYMVTRSSDTVSLAWQAGIRGGSGLIAQLDTMDSASGAGDGSGGEFRLSLRLGESQASPPDHVIFVVDRSRSTQRHLQRAAGRVFAAYLDTLGSKATFELLAFDRTATRAMPSLDSAPAPRAGDDEARTQLLSTLDSAKRAQGSDIDGALQLVAARLATRKARRPLVIFVTDGVVPSAVKSEDLAARFDKTRAGTARPEIVFLVDDPLLNLRGLSPDSPIARVAGTLGARIRRETLANLSRDDVAGLAATPRVLTSLGIDLPRGVTIDGALPRGLIAGQIAVIEGRYTNKAPSSLNISGRAGTKRVRIRARARRRDARPQALVSAGVGRDEAIAVAQGFALPDWHSRDLARETELSVANASHDGSQRQGFIDGEIVKRHMHTRVFPRASACYNRALMGNQVLEGRVVFEFELGKGEVMSAAVNGAEFNYELPRFIECLEAAAWALEVPAGKLDAETYRVRYPLRFTPPEGGQAPQTRDGPDPLFEMLINKADTLAQ
jgi:hypothetical protein